MIFERLKTNYSDDNLIYLMNNIAKNEVTNNNELNMKKGGVKTSVVDYLNSKGLNSTYKNREVLYKRYIGGDYSGTAAQNTNLLNILKKTYQYETVRPKTVISDRPVLTDFNDIINNYVKSPIESGVVIDKNTNQGYVLKNGKPVKNFPVITGRNRQDAPSIDINSGTTPTGFYTMTSSGLEEEDRMYYDNNIFKLNPLSVDGYNTPIASNLGIHQTYDPMNRNKLYNQSPSDRYASYGCVNCRKSDMESMMNTFPQGDTLMVIDQNNPYYKGMSRILNNNYNYGGYKSETNIKKGGKYRGKKWQEGGEIPVDPNGYLKSNEANWANEMIIPSNTITSNGLEFPIIANGRYIEPNTGDYQFSTPFVHEQPMYQQGGPTLPGRTGINYNSPADRNFLLADLVNYSVGQGQMPLKTEYGRILAGQGLNSNDQSLINNVIAFNTNPANIARNTEDRINSFYNTYASDPTVQTLRAMGSGPLATYNNSPDYYNQMLQSMAKNKYNKGGKYRK